MYERFYSKTKKENKTTTKQKEHCAIIYYKRKGKIKAPKFYLYIEIMIFIFSFNFICISNKFTNLNVILIFLV